jgi:hypothetical protein
MRKLFAGTATLGLAGALLVGGVFAWSSSDSTRGIARVGENAFSIHFEPQCDGPAVEAEVSIEDLFDAEARADADLTPIPCYTLIGPNGSSTIVGRGYGMNDGDFDLRVTGGHVRVHRVHGGGACGPSDFGGAVKLTQPNRLIPPGGQGGNFIVMLNVARSAPEDCQGKFLGYRVVIEAENPPSFTPGDAQPREEDAIDVSADAS